MTEPGDRVTADGCPVEVYARLPARGEPELVHALVRPSGSILDLGAGVGRIADPLVRLGHRVVAVDDSAAMLAHVRLAEPVCARIETLRLAQRFDAVLLASHLVNSDDDAQRYAFLQTAADHLADGAQVLIEWHPPAWFDGLVVGRRYAGTIGDVATDLVVRARAERGISAEVGYELGGERWTQPFTARRLGEADLADELAVVGLVAESTSDPNWIAARAAHR